jgi:hypothetical protein
VHREHKKAPQTNRLRRFRSSQIRFPEKIHFQVAD